MEDQGLGQAPRTLVDRVKAILLTPKTEWVRIDSEPATVGELYRNYAIILAAIPALSWMIGSLVFGFGAFFIHFRPSIPAAIAQAITQYILSLVGVGILALIIDALAPTFSGTKNRVQAFKVAIYSATASWVVGIVGLIPALAPLGILGLYSLYLFYTGLPVLMKAPAEKALAYTAVTIVAAIVLFLIVGALTHPVLRMFGGGYGPDPSQIAGTVTVPGAGSVDLGKLQDASKKMEQAAQQMSEAAKPGAAGKPTDPAALAALLPPTIGQYKRTEVESSGGSAAGIGGSSAGARYVNGASNFRLEINDVAAAGALAALGSAMNVQSNRQTETGYEKTTTVNGQIVTEKWDNSSKEGSYGTMIANRFMVQAEGNAASIDELKAAVAALSPAQIVALAH